MHPAFQEAPDGETALALMERESFDIIISDYRMRQLRVKFGVGGISPEGFRQVTEELRRKRAQLEMEILGGRRAMHP